MKRLSLLLVLFVQGYATAQGPASRLSLKETIKDFPRFQARAQDERSGLHGRKPGNNCGIQIAGRNGRAQRRLRSRFSR